MTTTSRFATLFEPIRIGPVTAPNRFYQVPHCTGMGYERPRALAAMRGIKAEGGWGVVNTEYCSIHPTSDDGAYPFCSLWDEDDVRAMAAMVAAVKAHGSLAGVELWHGGFRASNLVTREPAIGPSSLPVSFDPWQCRAMDFADIRAFRTWHKMAARRAKQAGYDIVYVYAGHTYLLAQFLDPVINQRSDAYGGSMENRWRLVREVLEDTREAVGDHCAVAMRVEVNDERGGSLEERREMLMALAPLVDLYNLTITDYSQEMGTSRFVPEGSLEPHIAGIRALTGKPVVSVGRFTSPDSMLAQVKRGVLDLIGAARPSIADPFLPLKIREGRFDDIRECIGCNICYAGNSRSAPIRCTQNPTMGEEWRRGWHPENFGTASDPEDVLIVGAGPAGLEAAHVLGKRGHRVTVAEARNELGGRVTRESRLPGLSEWARVRDYRVQQLNKLANVAVHKSSPMTADDVLETGIRHVILATGSRWRAHGQGRQHPAPAAGFAGQAVLTPDDIMDGKLPAGPAVIFDDEGYSIASVIAELLVAKGIATTYVTPDGVVSAWSEMTGEQHRIQARLIELGVRIVVSHAVTTVTAKSVTLACVYSGRESFLACGGLVSVTSRAPADDLWQALTARAHGLASLHRIGDCVAPGLIAQAVHDGHRVGREFGVASVPAVRRDRVVVAT